MVHLRVVGTTTHVGMHDPMRRRSLGSLQRLTVQARFQNRFNAPIGTGADGQCSCAGGLHSLCWVAPGQSHQTQAGTVALFRIPPRSQDIANDTGRRRANLTSPIDKPFRCPFQISAVLRWPVLRQGRMSAHDRTAGVYCHTATVAEDLDSCSLDTRLQLLVPELEGNAVVVTFNLDMIVDVRPDFFPLAKDEGFRRQGLQSRTFDALEKLGSTRVELAELAVVQSFEKFTDGLVECHQPDECPMTKRGEYPPFHHEHARLDFRFISRLSYPCRQNH